MGFGKGVRVIATFRKGGWNSGHVFPQRESVTFNEIHIFLEFSVLVCKITEPICILPVLVVT